LIRLEFFGFTVTARQRYCSLSFFVHISLSMALRTVPAITLEPFVSAALHLSIVQNNVSVNVDGVMFIVDSVHTLVG
jgi:hypothetical protein